MAQYLNPIDPLTIPAGINVAEIANHVFALLQTTEAIQDLCLPPPPWPAPTTSSISVQFVQHPTHVNMPESNTVILAGVLTCFINNSVNDLGCLPLIQGRLAHELTHALRSTIVHEYNVATPALTPFQRTTPSKKPRQRVFRSATLFGMTEARSCSGYWIEHRLCQGIVVALYGSYLTKDENGVFSAPVVIAGTGIFFKLHHQGGNHRVDELSYKANYGSIFDPVNGNFSPYVVIYHSGIMITRGNGHH